MTGTLVLAKRDNHLNVPLQRTCPGDLPPPSSGFALLQYIWINEIIVWVSSSSSPQIHKWQFCYCQQHMAADDGIVIDNDWLTEHEVQSLNLHPSESHYHCPHEHGIPPGVICGGVFQHPLSLSECFSTQNCWSQKPLWRPRAGVGNSFAWRATLGSRSWWTAQSGGAGN